MNTLTPEFCYINYCNYDVFGVTPSTSNFAATVALARALHNHNSETTNSTSGLGTDVTRAGTPAEHTLTFDEAKVVTSIKLLNHNFKNFTVELFINGDTWTTVIDETAYTKNYYNFYQAAGSGYLLITAAGDFLLTSSGLLAVTGSTYTQVRLKVYSTQTANQEKYIGELYIGARAFKLSTGRLLEYKTRSVDPYKFINNDYNGSGYISRSAPNDITSLSFINTSLEEYLFLKDFSKLGGLYNFFPTGTEIGYELSTEFAFNNVSLVTCISDWDVSPWGRRKFEQIDIEFMRSKYVTGV